MAYIGQKPANKAVVADDLDPTVITGQTALTDKPADTDEFLISDAGTLKRIDASLVGGGGTSWQSAVKTANFTAASGEGYFINTSGGAFEVDLPSSPSVGDQIEFVDFSRNFATANLTLDQGSVKFQGNATSPKPVYSTNGQNIKIVYSGSTQGWIPLRDDDVTFETPQPVLTEYLVVAGGGSGGRESGGGGGAGGLLTNYGGTKISLTAGQTYTVTVGGGGAAVTSDIGGNNGNNSVLSGTGITTVTAIGGGSGGNRATDAGNGGSGGGGGSKSGGGAAGSGTSGQGNDGGNGINSAPQHGGGGGGGAGAAGGNGTSSAGGVGGAGSSNSITGSAVTYAGGGGGSTDQTNGAAGAGGAGGGGEGAFSSAAGDGTDGLGGGGGGVDTSSSSGAGGDGVVILRLPTSVYSGTTTGSPTVTTDGTDTIIKFTSSGSYTA